mgnify:CR=1 FL=1
MRSLKNKKICIIVSNYNEDITMKALAVAKKKLKSQKFLNISVIHTSGAFEIPVTISRLIRKYDAFIAIGCIIKGKTNNFDLICSSITNGIMKLSIKHGKPIGNSIITTFNKIQAKERVDKGSEAAVAIIDILRNEPKRI